MRTRLSPALAIALATAAAVLLRTFVVDFFVVIGPSMEPTLRSGSVVVVLKCAYGLQAPFWGYVGSPMRPARGDVVVATSPLSGARVIKRVAWVGPTRLDLWGSELVGDGYSVSIGEDDAHWFSGGVSVPEGWVFLVGDNDFESVDSRTYGCVPPESITGKALFIGGGLRP